MKTTFDLAERTSRLSHTFSFLANLNEEDSWKDKVVNNPKTGNKVKVSSLPPEEQQKFKPKKKAAAPKAAGADKSGGAKPAGDDNKKKIKELSAYAGKLAKGWDKAIKKKDDAAVKSYSQAWYDVTAKIKALSKKEGIEYDEPELKESAMKQRFSLSESQARFKKGLSFFIKEAASDEELISLNKRRMQASLASVVKANDKSSILKAVGSLLSATSLLVMVWDDEDKKLDKLNTKLADIAASIGESKVLSELLDKKRMKELSPEIASDILSVILLKVADEYKRQTGEDIEDPKDLAILVMGVVKNVWRLKSELLQKSKVFIRNPNSARTKIKQSISSMA